MNVALAAEESAGLHMLRALARSDHRVVAVLTAPPEAGSTRASLWNVARDFGFETLPATRVRNPDLADTLRSKNVDILLNVHSLHIIKREVLAAPKLGAFNLHHGPLPRYAGLNSVSWALFRGEQSHGVTIHRMVPEIDAGPIVYQAAFPIEADDTALSLTFKCTREGIKLMLQLLDVAASQPAQIPVVQQDSALREYFGAEVPEQGRMSWYWPASKVMNFVRACDYFPFHSPWGIPLLISVRKRWHSSKPAGQAFPAMSCREPLASPQVWSFAWPARTNGLSPASCVSETDTCGGTRYSNLETGSPTEQRLESGDEFSGAQQGYGSGRSQHGSQDHTDQARLPVF